MNLFNRSGHGDGGGVPSDGGEEGGVLPSDALTRMMSLSRIAEDAAGPMAATHTSPPKRRASPPVPIGAGALGTNLRGGPHEEAATALQVPSSQSRSLAEPGMLCGSFGNTTNLGSDTDFELAYSLGQELGRGGWATVFAAQHRVSP